MSSPRLHSSCRAPSAPSPRPPPLRPPHGARRRGWRRRRRSWRRPTVYDRAYDACEKAKERLHQCEKDLQDKGLAVVKAEKLVEQITQE
eukprot:9283378-Pyramimonas_sp.AAC.1